MEADGLENAYQSLTEGPTKIDYVSFLEDVRLQAGTIDNNQVVLNKDQQDLINNLANLFKSNKLEAEMCQSLKNQDYLDHGYMTKDQLKSAIDEAMTKVPAKAGRPTAKLASNQFNTLYSVMSQDSQGRYNWKQLLYSMFGQQETQTILNKQLGQPQSQQQQYNAQPTAQIQAESPFMGQIGKKVGSNQNMLVQDIQRSAKQVVQGAPLIGEYEISNILARMQLQLTVDERTELSIWCQRNQDSNQLVNGHKLLQAIGFQPPSVEKKGPPKRVLTEQELKQSQDVIVLIRKEIMSRGIRPEQVIEKHRKSISDVSMSPKSFRDALMEEFNKSPTIAPKIESKTILSDLIHYLVKEEPGRVSYAKLLQALALQDHEAPLKQDNIDDMLQYQAKVQNQLSAGGKIPLSIIELNQFMKKQNLSLQTLLELHQNQLSSDIPVAQFEKSLSNNGYMPKELLELIKSLQTPMTGTTKVSVAVLQKHLKSLVPVDSKDPRQAQAKFGKMNPLTKSKIQLISDYLIRNNLTIEILHKTLDINNDGFVDKLEFVDGVSKIITTTSLTRQDLGTIFDAIDLNGDNYLSVNEFGYYLDGAKLQKDQKKAQLDQGTIMEVTREIDSLFAFLESGKGYVTAIDINRSMTGLGQNITIEKAQEMVRTVDRDNDGHISRPEFQQLMLPILLDELVAGDDHLEDMRAKFREADTDYSGFLSVDEFYACLLSMGTDVQRQEVVNMFTEFDVNQDMQIDIDEFIKFFSVGEQIEFQEEQNINTYMKIKKARKLNIMDFLRAFNQMPQSFTQSFFAERWNKAYRNLPSSVFKAQIDPRTMLWKDMAPVLTEELPQTMIKPENRPRLRPVPTTLGATITIEGAEGVPLPAQSAEFDRANIVKRVIRIGLFDQVKHELIHNSAQVVAEWNNANEDVWTFNNSNTASLNPVLFRTTDSDDLNRQDVVLVFELVVYVKQQTKTTEWTAGWAQTPIITCEKDMAKVRLEIQGGSPLNALAISKDDVQTKRSGMKAIMKMFNSNIKSTIIVSFKPIQFIEAEAKLHLELLPSTCLIQKKMLYLVSGYRNYAAELLLPLMAAGNLKQPVGNVVMSCFCKILDSPDLLETVAQIWTEDHFATLTLTQKKSIELVMKKMEDIVTRIYPVLFSEGFAYHSSNQTESACGDPVKNALRKQLVTHALRFNNPAAKVKVTQPPDSFTTFKPFNVREIEFEVWTN